MRLLDFFDGAESETAPTIGNIVASALVKYADDAAYEANEQDAPATGNVYYNTTDNTIRYYNGTLWQELIDETTTQAVENKVIDADNNTLTNIDNNEIKPAAAIDVTKLHDGSVDNTEFGHLDGVTSPIQTQLDNKQEISEKNQPNGYAGLDGDGRISESALPVTALIFRGVWDASTNTPALADGVGTQGDVYRTSVAGTQDLGSGPITFEVGDWVTYNGSEWQRSDFEGAGVLNDLQDVDTTGVTEGQILIYNDVAGEWQPGDRLTVVQENISLIGKGTASWNTNDLVLSDDIFVNVNPLPNSYHTIQAQTITILNNQCAYVTLNRNAVATTNLTVTVDDIVNVTPDNDILVFATVNNNDLYLGLHDPTRLEDGDTVTIQKSEVNVFTRDYFESQDVSNFTLPTTFGSFHRLNTSWSLTVPEGTWDLEAQAAISANANAGRAFYIVVLSTESSAASVSAANIVAWGRGSTFSDNSDEGGYQAPLVKGNNVVFGSSTTIYAYVRGANLSGASNYTVHALRNDLQGTFAPGYICAKKVQA